MTGVTGTFGEAFVAATHSDWTIRGLSRDEYKQVLLAERFPGLRLLLGDVRDLPRLKRAAQGCDIVIHAAALKQVPKCESDPEECVKTNVVGTMNVIEACLDAGVEKAVLLSSDKAVHPANLYGASKKCAEALWLAANVYAGTRFSAVRYGNVKGSRGSVLDKVGPVTLTDARATRFWMEASEAVDLVLLALREMQGGEVFVPKLEARRTVDTRDEWIAGTGLRPGEKLHETLISEEEVPRTSDWGDHYRILPPGYITTIDQDAHYPVAVPADFSYTSEVTAA